MAPDGCGWVRGARVPERDRQRLPTKCDDKVFERGEACRTPQKHFMVRKASERVDLRRKGAGKRKIFAVERLGKTRHHRELRNFFSLIGLDSPSFTLISTAPPSPFLHLPPPP